MDYGCFGWEDRRRFQRLKVNLGLYFKIEGPLTSRYITGDKEVEATMLNISAGGVAFLTRYDLPVWSDLLIRLYLFKSNYSGAISLSNPVEILGQVRSNIITEFQEHRIGVCFKEVRGNNKFAVADSVESVVRP